MEKLKCNNHEECANDAEFYFDILDIWLCTECYDLIIDSYIN